MLPFPRGAAWQALFLLGVLLFINDARPEGRVVCYYTNWSVYRPGTAKFNPQNINPYLCTHLVYAFGGFTKDNQMKPFDKYQDIEQGGYAKFTGLKTYNKQLKTMIAIGGWNEASSRFSPLVASSERRHQFIKNILKFLRQNHFDGIDLDWEYPAHREGGKSRDRDNYAQFVQELRAEFEREAEKTGRTRLLLTMAVPAGIEYIDKGYDIPKLNKYLDWFNVLTYDFHSSHEPSVNHHAPLYSLEEESEYNYDAELNIDYSIKYYLKAGADRDKLVLGIPTYGRSYTLINEESTDMGAPSEGPGEQGDATREKGYLAYYEICQNLKEDSEWTVVQPNPTSMGPYAYRRNQWVGYDDEAIVRKKAEYAVAHGLGGIMFWAIDNDDFRGTCGGKPYPLIEAAKEAMIEALGLGINEVPRPNAPQKPVRSRSRENSSSTTRNRISSTSDTKDTQRKENGRRPPAGVARKSTTTTSAPSTTIKLTDAEGSSLYIGGRTSTPPPPTTPDPGADFKCEEEGFFQHPRDCKKYYWCLDSGPSGLGIVAHQFTCPSGLYFNPAADSCDFARNVPCKTKKSTTAAPVTTSSTTTTVRPTSSSNRITAATSRTSFLRTTPPVTTTTTTSTTTQAPDVDDEDLRYEDEDEDDTRSANAKPTDKDAEEDPQVIKELIELIRKLGGVEELEKHLLRKEDGSISIKDNTANGAPTTPSSISKSLYDKVLSRPGTLSSFRNHFTTTSAFRKKEPAKSEANSNVNDEEAGETDARSNIGTSSYSKYSSVVRGNSRQGPQNAGLEKLSEFEGFLKEKKQYVTINRNRGATRLSGKSAEEDEVENDTDKEVAEEEQEEELNVQTTRRPMASTPSYTSLRRTRPTTAAPEIETAAEKEDRVVKEEKKTYASLSRNRGRPTTTATAKPDISDDIVSSTTRYKFIERTRPTKAKPLATNAEEDSDQYTEDDAGDTDDDEDEPQNVTVQFKAKQEHQQQNPQTTTSTRIYASIGRRTTTTTTPSEPTETTTVSTTTTTSTSTETPSTTTTTSTEKTNIVVNTTTTTSTNDETPEPNSTTTAFTSTNPTVTTSSPITSTTTSHTLESSTLSNGISDSEDDALTSIQLTTITSDITNNNSLNTMSNESQILSHDINSLAQDVLSPTSTTITTTTTTTPESELTTTADDATASTTVRTTTKTLTTTGTTDLTTENAESEKYQFNRSRSTTTRASTTAPTIASTTSTTTTRTSNRFTSRLSGANNRRPQVTKTVVVDHEDDAIGSKDEDAAETDGGDQIDDTATTTSSLTATTESTLAPTPRRIRVLKFRRPIVDNSNNSAIANTVTNNITESNNTSTATTNSQNTVTAISSLDASSHLENESVLVDATAGNETIKTSTENSETQPNTENTTPTKRFRKVIRKLIRPINATNAVDSDAETTPTTSVSENASRDNTNTTLSFAQKRQNSTRYSFNRSGSLTNTQPQTGTEAETHEEKTKVLTVNTFSRGRSRFSVHNDESSTSEAATVGGRKPLYNTINRGRIGSRVATSTTPKTATGEDDNDDDNNSDDEYDEEEQENGEEEDQKKGDDIAITTSTRKPFVPRKLTATPQTSLSKDDEDLSGVQGVNDGDDDGTTFNPETQRKPYDLQKLRDRLKVEQTKGNQEDGVINSRLRKPGTASDSDDTEDRNDALQKTRSKLSEDQAIGEHAVGVINARLKKILAERENITSVDGSEDATVRDENTLEKIRNKVKEEQVKANHDGGVISSRLKTLLRDRSNSSNVTIAENIEDTPNTDNSGLQKLRDKVKAEQAKSDQDQGVINSRLKKLLSEKGTSSTVTESNDIDGETETETSTGDADDLNAQTRPALPRRPYAPNARTTTLQPISEDAITSSTAAPSTASRPTFRRKLIAKRPFTPGRPSVNLISTTERIFTSQKPRQKFVRRKFGRFDPFNSSVRNTGQGFVRTDPRGARLPGTNRFKSERGSSGANETVDDNEYEEYEDYEDEEETAVQDDKNSKTESNVASVATTRPTARSSTLFNRPQSSILKKPTTDKKKPDAEAEDTEEEDEEDDEESEEEDGDTTSLKNDAQKPATPKLNGVSTFKAKDNRIPPGSRPSFSPTGSANVPFNPRNRPATNGNRPQESSTASNRFGNTRTTSRPRVVNRPPGVASPNLTLKPVASDYERTTPLSPIKPAPFIPTNTRSYERKYAGSSTESPEATSENSLIEDLNIDALNARNKKIFDIHSKKHTTLKPKLLVPFGGGNKSNATSDELSNTQDQNIETEDDDVYDKTQFGGDTEQGFITTTQRTTYQEHQEIQHQQQQQQQHQHQDLEQTDTYINTDSNSQVNANEAISSQEGSSSVTTTPQAPPATTLLHVFTLIGDEEEVTTSHPLTTAAGVAFVPRLLTERVQPKHKVVEINRIVEINSKEDKLRRKSKANQELLKTVDSSGLKVVSLPHVEQLGEISVVKYVHLVDGSDIVIDGHSTVADYTPTEPTATRNSAPVRNSIPNAGELREYAQLSAGPQYVHEPVTISNTLQERYGKALVPEVIREAVETSTISLEGLFDNARKGKELNTIDGVYLTTLPTNQEHTPKVLQSLATQQVTEIVSTQQKVTELASESESATATTPSSADATATDSSGRATTVPAALFPTYLRTPTASYGGTTVSRRPVLSVRRRIINTPATPAAPTAATAAAAAAAPLPATTEPTIVAQQTTLKYNRLRSRPTTTTATHSNKYYLSNKPTTAEPLSAASPATAATFNADGNGNTQKQQHQQQSSAKLPTSSTALRRKFQTRRLITTTTTTATSAAASGNAESATEPPHTPNPLFKRRFSLANNRLAAAPTTRTASEDASLTTTTALYPDAGTEAEETTDQVAKSSIHTNRFNQLANLAVATTLNGPSDTDPEDSDAKAPAKVQTTTTTTTTTTTALKAANLNKSKTFAAASDDDNETITRRMDIGGYAHYDTTAIATASKTAAPPATTTTATTTKTTRRPVVSKRRPHKTTLATPTAAGPTTYARSAALANRRHPHKYTEPFDRLEQPVSRQHAPATAATPTKPALSSPKRAGAGHVQTNFDYDYYDDEDVRLVGSTKGQQLKVILHGRGIIECLDQGNFPHPLSCRKFISCAKFETGGVVGWEYTCPKGLSYDPVGGMCNWAAGLGCKE